MARTIEFTIQQFYIMHRKPFMLQLFGSVAPLLDTDGNSVYGDASKVRVQSLFRLLLSLERVGVDPLHLLDLVAAEKPLKALDFCYHGELDTINILDSIALAVMGASYAIDTYRGHQLLVIIIKRIILVFFLGNNCWLFRWYWKRLFRLIWSICRPASAAKILVRKETSSINLEWRWKRSSPMRKR